MSDADTQAHHTDILAELTDRIERMLEETPDDQAIRRLQLIVTGPHEFPEKGLQVRVMNLEAAIPERLENRLEALERAQKHAAWIYGVVATAVVSSLALAILGLVLKSG